MCAELLAAIQLYTKLNPAASDMSPFELTEKLMDAMAATDAALAQPVAEGPRTSSEWHLLSLEQPSVNALCEYICHTNNWGVIQDKGKWYEQTSPKVSGFTNSHSVFVSNPTQTLWRLAQATPQPEEADIHYAWELEDAEGEWQAGGSANSLEDVQREGNRYLQTYSQDAPHKLIIQRHFVTTIEEVTND